MNKYNFYDYPSEICKIIHLNNFKVYLDKVFLCHNASTIIISYTITGKHLNAYDKNGERIYSHHFLPNVTGISFYKVYNAILFHSILTS